MSPPPEIDVLWGAQMVAVMLKLTPNTFSPTLSTTDRLPYVCVLFRWHYCITTNLANGLGGSAIFCLHNWLWGVSPHCIYFCIIYLQGIRTVRLGMRCVSCLRAGRPINRYDFQLAILLPPGTKKVAPSHLAFLIVIEISKMEDAWVRVQLGKNQHTLLWVTSHDSEGYQIVQAMV